MVVVEGEGGVMPGWAGPHPGPTYRQSTINNNMRKVIESRDN